MTFKELNIAIMQDSILRTLLPMQCKRTYPRLESDGETLYASFVGFHMKGVSGGAEAEYPSYYLKIAVQPPKKIDESRVKAEMQAACPKRTAPNLSLRAFVKLSRPDFKAHLMTPAKAETIRELASLCDLVLAGYEENAENLTETVNAYNKLLDSVLEKEQLAVLNQMAALTQ